MTDSLKDKQKRFIQEPIKEDFSSYEDWVDVVFDGSKEDITAGKRLLQEGKVACLLLAGGQGSRLGQSVAKGLVPVSAVEQKTLFQIFFEKVLYAGKKFGRKLPLAIMTSSYNHEEIVTYLTSKGWFGLSEDQIYFFSQDNLPFCDEEGDPIVTDLGKILKGPDGNGRALHKMYEVGIVDTFQKMGVEHINVVQVDNPLADPFDEALIGFNYLKGSDISVIAVKTERQGEKAGVLASDQGACRIIEYTEKLGRSFSFLNTGLFCFSVNFIEQIAKNKTQMPWHGAYKKITDDTFAWKFEYFLFDVFAYAKNISVLVEPRSKCFSPLKNAAGDDSLQTVRQDLIRKDKARYFVLTGKEAPLEDIELCFALYYLDEKEKINLHKITGPRGTYILQQSL